MANEIQKFTEITYGAGYLAALNADVDAQAALGFVLQSVNVGYDGTTILHYVHKNYLNRESAATELTLDANGEITITQGFHTVDTLADAASDNLDTISGMVDGQTAWLRPASGARDVVIRHGQDNIFCPGAQNITLAEATDWALVACDGANVSVIAFHTQALGGGGLGAALASIANGLGTALLGSEDAGNHFDATTAEGQLQEIGALLTEESSNVLQLKRMAKATYDFATDGGAIGSIGIGPSLPDNAVITRLWYEVLTTFTSATDAATVALSIPTDDSGGLKAAVAISNGANPWDAGFHDGIQDGAAANFSEKTTAERQITMDIAVEALTAGKMMVFAEYFVSE